jgi:hypothetical protein
MSDAPITALVRARTVVDWWRLAGAALSLVPIASLVAGFADLA